MKREAPFSFVLLSKLKGMGSEWQVVGSTVAGRLLCRWEWSRRGRSSRCHGVGRREGHGGGGCTGNGSGSGNRLSYLPTNDVEGSNFVEPTAVIFVSVNIELNGQLFAGLNVELLDAVFTKEAEHTLAWILAWHFDDILLAHPRIASTL